MCLLSTASLSRTDDTRNELAKALTCLSDITLMLNFHSAVQSLRTAKRIADAEV